MKFSTQYQTARKCVGGEQPGARALQDFLLAELGQLEGCDTVDSGIYNCRRIRGSFTRFSTHAEGRAGDTGVRLPGGGWPTNEIDEPGIWEWAERLIRNAPQLGIQYVIYARKSCKPGEQWSRYRGTSPHYDHIHWELTREAAEQLTPEHVRSVLKPNESEPNMLELFISSAYLGKRGASPFHGGPDLAGALYWVRAANEENPTCAWTWQDCLESPALGVMVSLLLAEK